MSTLRKKLVFEKVKFDPLSNPDVFGIGVDNNEAMSPANVDSGWDSDEKKEASTTKSKKQVNDEDKDNNEEEEEEE